MGNWLSELVQTNRLKSIEEENKRPAPWEGRTRAELIYGRQRNDEEPGWNWDGPPAVAVEAKPDISLTSAPQVQPLKATSPETASIPESAAQLPAVAKKPPFDIDKAVKYLEDNAAGKSTGKCAKSVRRALQHSGFYLPEHPEDAREYGDYLEWGGLSKVDKTNYVPQKGDVAVIQPPVKGEPGHMQMYGGEKWLSDYKQKNSTIIYPSQAYQDAKPKYEIYR